MRIFISYASEDRRQVEEVALALLADGHEVFFDREISFRVTGLLPLVRGTWSWPPLATAD